MILLRIFADDQFFIQNPGQTFEYQFIGSALAADRTVTLPLLTGNDVFVFEAHTQTLTNKTLSTGTAVSSSITFSDGVTQTFNPDATNAGINVGSHTAEPSTPTDGDIFYDATANQLKGRVNGAWVDLGGGGGGDNLGDHTATQRLIMGTDSIEFSTTTSLISGDAGGITVDVPSGDHFDVKVNGAEVTRADVNGFYVGGTSTGRPLIRTSSPSTGNPNISWSGDTNTGLAHSGLNDNYFYGIGNGQTSFAVRDGYNFEIGGSVIGNDFGGTTSGQGTLRFNDVTTTPSGVLANGGLLYVSGTSLFFHDDGGTATDLTAFGDVTKVGTPSNNQIGVWTGDGTIQGTNDFIYDEVAQTMVVGDATTTPVIAINKDDASNGQLDFQNEGSGAGDRLLFSSSEQFTIQGATEIRFDIDQGGDEWEVLATTFGSLNSTGGELIQTGGTATAPFVRMPGDVNSGIGGTVGDLVSMVSNAKAAVVATDAGTTNNVELFGNNALFGATTAGQGVLRFNDVVQAPAGTMTSGGLLYVQGTALNFMDDAGTITDLTAGGGGGDMLLGTIQTVTAAKTFNDNTLLLDDSDSAFDLILRSTSTITTADKSLTFDVNDGNRTLEVGANTVLSGGTHSGTNTGDETQASINALAITEVGTVTTGTWNGNSYSNW